MKEATMAVEWRTIQFFLDEDGVQEVQLQYHNPNELRCTCGSRANKCKHVSYVRSMFKKNDFVFDLEVPADEDEDILAEALASAELFREMIIKYGKVAVID